MRVHKGDLLRLESAGEETAMRVVRLEPSAKRLRLAGHLEGGDLQKRHDDPGDPFRWSFVSFDQLRRRRARKVSVDILGRVLDGGFKE
jgi:CRISPR-associated endonuclease Csn1